MSRVISLAAASLLFSSATASVLPYAPIHPVRRQNNTSTNETTSTTFDDINPSPELTWVDCYGPNRQCSKLTVPLDYEAPETGTIDIAIIRYVISEDAEDLLFNPGGPGGAGIPIVTELGGNGEKWAKEWGYNFVTFDPRGVGESGPKISCAPSNRTTSAKLFRRDEGTLANLTETWNLFSQQAKSCSAANENGMAKYVGTSAVVQDMLHFTKLQAMLKGKDPEEALINYFGISYGTVIGQTLVAMYPDRLRRVLMDSNVYGVSYYQGWGPTTGDDFAHGIWVFAKLCFEAGGEWCELAKDARNIDEVKERFDTVVRMLGEQAVVIGGEPHDANAFLRMVQQSMYFPRESAQGDYRKIAKWTSAILSGNTTELETAAPPKTETPEEPTTGEALLLITAADIAGRYPWQTYEQWKAAAERLESTTPYSAHNYVVSNGLIGLINIVPPPSQVFPGFTNVEPSVPVLFINTVADPVTPTSAARQMSRLFAGSGVLIIDGPGHGYVSAPSDCANQAIAAYWQNATVPTEEVLCETSVDANFYFGGPIPAAAWYVDPPAETST